MFLNEPADKTYYSTMYVRPAKTRVSLCIDPLYKASFLDSPETEEGAYCTISEGSDQNVQLRRLTRVFARRTRRFVKPIDCTDPCAICFCKPERLTFWVKFSTDILKYFYHSSKKTGFAFHFKLSPLHEMSNPVFLVIKQITIFSFFVVC